MQKQNILNRDAAEKIAASAGEALDAAFALLIHATRLTVEEYADGGVELDPDSIAQSMLEELQHKLDEWEGD